MRKVTVNPKSRTKKVTASSGIDTNDIRDLIVAIYHVVDVLDSLDEDTYAAVEQVIGGSFHDECLNNVYDLRHSL